MATKKEKRILKSTTVEGIDIEIPVGVLQGAQPGPTLCVMAGVHGTEYVGMEAALRLFQSVDPGEIVGKVVIVLVADAQALFDWSMFGSRVDGKNLAQAYPGKEDGSYSEVLAHILVGEVVSEADYLVDLHGGELVEAMNPYVGCSKIGDENIDEASYAMAEVFGLPYISIWERKGGLGDLLRIPSIYPEVGGQGKCDEELVELDLKGLLNVMKYLRMMGGEPERTTKPTVFVDKHWLTAEMVGIFYPKVSVTEWVVKGQIIGEVRDFFGELLQEVVAPADSVVMNVNVGRAVKKDGFLAWLGVV